MSKPLTPEQIKNWREALFKMLGPYAFIMPESQVQAFRNKFQDMIANIEKPTTPEPR